MTTQHEVTGQPPEPCHGFYATPMYSPQQMKDCIEKAVADEHERSWARFNAALLQGSVVLDSQVREGVKNYVVQTIRNAWINWK